MINVTDLFGREGMAGIITYLVVSFLVSGPISQRHAERFLIDQCKRGHVDALKQPRVKTFEESLRDQAADALKQSGPVGEILGGLLSFRSNLHKRQAAINAVELTATCGCRISLALQRSDVQWAWTTTVASWRVLNTAPGLTLATAARINPEGVCTGGRS